MTRKKRILVCDDDPAFLDLYQEILGAADYDIVRTATGEECLKAAAQDPPDVILLDVKLPGLSGHAVCATLKHGKATQYIPLVFVTATFHEVADRVNGIEMGADDYILKPFSPDELIVRVKALLRIRDLQEKLFREQQSKVFLSEEIKSLEAQLRGTTLSTAIIGKSPRMVKIVELIESIRDTVATVLILGETGTGKGLVAEAVHRTSARREGPFLKVDCSALAGSLLESELFGHEAGAFTGAIKARHGRFERTHGGTIFLDEIGEVPLELQPKLLRVIQDMEFERVGGDETVRVDVRIIAATNVELEQAVEAKLFRKDLFYRLNVIRIDLPPLRERTEDIPLLANHFLLRYAVKNHKEIGGFEESAMRTLIDYAWPGNVRELENVVERAVVLCPGPQITPDLIVTKPRGMGAPAPARTDRSLREVLDETEKRLVTAALERCGGSVDQAARVLGLNRTTLYSKIKKHQLRID